MPQHLLFYQTPQKLKLMVEGIEYFLMRIDRPFPIP